MAPTRPRQRFISSPTAATTPHQVLRAVVEFGALMMWYFVSDRTTILDAGEKTYSRDLFFFLFVILTCVAAGASLQTFKTPLLLNRPQTEEWKGWMQVGAGPSSQPRARAAPGARGARDKGTTGERAAGQRGSWWGCWGCGAT